MLTAQAILQLHRAAGNGAVVQLLQQSVGPAGLTATAATSARGMPEAATAPVAGTHEDHPPLQRQYLHNVLGSALGYLKSLTLDAPLHVWRLIKHVVVGLPVAIFDVGSEVVKGLVSGFQGNWGQLATHLGRALVNGVAWPAQLLGKVLDLVGFGEFMDLMMQIAKPNTRPLNAAELAAAQQVYGNRIDYARVRVDEHSILNNTIFRRLWVAFTTWHTINWPTGSNFTTDPGTFIHELGHVWQMEQRGTQYIVEAPYHGGIDGAGYIFAVDRNPVNNANGAQLANARANGKTIFDYGLEQQCEICRHFYVRQVGGYATVDFQPYINDVQGLSALPLKVRIRQP